MTKFKRVVAFGCSHTYGHGLSDCIKDEFLPGEQPSKFAYPNVLANKLGIECVNNSSPGASNLEILLTILEFNFLPEDLVVVMWSHTDRGLLFTEEKQELKIMPWLLRDDLSTHPRGILFNWLNNPKKINTPRDSLIDIARSFYEIHSDYHLTLTSWLYMYMAFMFLDNMPLKKVILSYHEWDAPSNPILDCRTIKEDFDSFAVDRADDGFHSGVKSNEIWADKIFEWLHNNN